MSSYKPLIEVANKTSTSVLASSPIPFNTAVHGNSCALSSNGIGVTINKAGYYSALAKVTFTAPVAGEVVLSIVKDGVVIDSAQVTTAINTTYNVVIPTTILSKCCTLPNTITVVPSLAITSLNSTLNIYYESERT